MKPFTEALKFEFPDLTQDSRVIDCGCFEGNWSYEIWNRYRCQIVALEPIPSFRARCIKRLAGTSVVVVNAALGGSSRSETLRIHGGMSGLFADGEPVQVDVLSVKKLLTFLNWSIGEELLGVYLLKLNCEGMEFEILESILSEGMAPMFSNIIVQPHTCVPDFEKRWKAIQDGLSRTHECVWAEPWCWEGYKLRV